MKKETEFLLCSNCFKDQGLRLDALHLGLSNKSVCPNCNTKTGGKLSQSLLMDLTQRFFVRGTLIRFQYGAAPEVQFNEAHYGKSDLEPSDWLKNDIQLLESKLKIGLFHYGPRFWMFGEIGPLKDLQKKSKRNKIINRILKEYPVFNASPNETFYRLRINPKKPEQNNEYDSPPENCIVDGRFDSDELSVLYGSPDLEICIHECRATVDDEIYVATLNPQKPLKFLDLTHLLIEEGITEFESLDLALNMIFLAGKHSYAITREIAKMAKKKGFDGLIYPSYFSMIKSGGMPFDTIFGISIRRFPPFQDHARAQMVQNIALFGKPIGEGKVKVSCINKVIISTVNYNVSFGPVKI